MVVVIRVVEVRQYVRNVRTRMPFRYGAATLTHVPVLHLRTVVESGGSRAEGWSADCLPPGWFDKRYGRVFRDDIASLRWAVETAAGACLAAAPSTPFALWRAAYEEVRYLGSPRNETGLTCGFGPALLERSVIDAVGKLAGTPLHETVRRNLLGLELGALHPALAGLTPADLVPAQPRDSMAVRHTIGLADPLTGADLADDQRLGDGLPQTFEDYLVQKGVRHVKLKVNGELERDLDRVGTVAALLDRQAADGYVVSLDGNEQYGSPEGVLALLDGLEARPELARFRHSIEFLEQPLARAVALDPAAAGLTRLAARIPVAIDESDDRIEAFGEAVALGYRGVSIKNCKGVTKAVANFCLAAKLTAEGAGRFFITGEDLMNTTVVPVHQDLATGAMLGLRHMERNGHHYVRGLDHLSAAERAGCRAHHASLYEPLGEGGQLRIRDGRLDLRSLRVPGYAVAFAPDWAALTPAEDWRYEDLGLDD